MKIEKVLLLRSPLMYLDNIRFEEPHPPLELAYLGAGLQSSYEVKLVDAFAESHSTEALGNGFSRAGMSDSEITAIINNYKPHIVCLSAMWTNQKRMVEHIAGVIKQVDPGIITVIGGNLPSAMPAVMLQCPSIDYVVLGEGENSILALIRSLNCGAESPKTKGVAYLRGGRLVNNGQNLVHELDLLPMPAYHLFNWEAYGTGFEWGRVTSSRIAGILATRGCTFSCNFCCLHNVGSRIFRHHSIERVISEMNTLKTEFGVGELQFYDYNLLNDPDFAKTLFREMISAKISLPWAATAGLSIWELSDEMLELAIGSGLYRLELPMESANRETRREIMAKDLYDNSSIKNIVTKAKSLGIPRLYAYVMVGSPGESMNSVKDSLYMLNELDVDVRIVKYAQPFPGTKFYDMCEENGYLPPNFSYDRLWFSLPNTTTPQVRPEKLLSVVLADKAYSLSRRGARSLTTSIKEVSTRYGIGTGCRTLVSMVDMWRRHRHIKFKRNENQILLNYNNTYGQSGPAAKRQAAVDPLWSPFSRGTKGADAEETS